ncbi:MAG TPA: signal peptidase I [Gaiellaceae bacterium]|nr:signal peptidase I [Gaiellaceae bacterium]
MKGPLDRLTGTLPSPWNTLVDWAVTIAIAVAAVLAIKAWVVNPYRIPSSSMEPTLHCAQPEFGCQAGSSDRVLANRFIYRFTDPERGQIVVFETPPEALRLCGAGGTYVKRLVAVPGDTIAQAGGIIRLNGTPITESYVDGSGPGPDFPERRLGDDEYFMMGDNREQSCDSRDWGPVSRDDLIGPVFAVYWPPTRFDIL